LVQSDFFPDAHAAKVLSAEGQVDPSGQHASPAHLTSVLPGHSTGSPTLQYEPVGDGVGAGPDVVQSKSFGFEHPPNAASADGQTEPSGQQLSPAQFTALPGQGTVSPILHAGDGAGVGLGVGGDGVGRGVGGAGVGVGVGGVGVGCGVGPGVGPVPSGHKVITYEALLFTFGSA